MRPNHLPTEPPTLPHPLACPGVLPAKPLWESLGLVAFSLTRQVSDYREMRRADVVRDLGQLGLIPPGSSARFAHQVHGSRLDRESEARLRDDAWWESAGCDGLTSDCPGVPSGLPLVILTADCCPIVMAGRAGNGRLWHAVLHAGWRGTLEGIVQCGIRAATESGVPLSGLHVWIGPHIAQEHYEVSPTMIEDFLSRYGSIGQFSTGRYLDVGMVNQLQCVEQGIPPGQIHRSGFCTFSSPELFPSYRRDGRCIGQVLTIAYAP